MLQIGHKSEKWQWCHNLPTWRHRHFSWSCLFLLSGLVTAPSFMSISSIALELQQFSFIRDWPEIRKSEIFALRFVSNKMLLNAARVLWIAYKGASLILEKLFNRFSFYYTVCFSVLVSRPHLDATIISKNVLRRSSTDVIIFSCRWLIWCFSCFRRLFQLIQDSAYNQMF